ncbi:MAG TPA: hypothetical protein VFU51_07435 [Gaiellaceae bacterium]|nr:hypothetical protein [Gaiellaceae bacterium]
MTRIEEARRKLTSVRYALGIGAAIALAAFAAAARVSHPATHHATQPAAAASEDDQDQGDFFGDGSFSNIGPSGSAAPQVQSGAS